MLLTKNLCHKTLRKRIKGRFQHNDKNDVQYLHVMHRGILEIILIRYKYAPLIRTLSSLGRLDAETFLLY